MNKQEALEALKENSWEFETNYFKYELVIDLKDAQEIVSQIDEPQKDKGADMCAMCERDPYTGGIICGPCLEENSLPKKVDVPKFVAEWVEELKKSHSNLAWVWRVYPNEPEIKKWLESNTEKFMRAWLDGYEIEQEKLYTVEIAEAILTKITRGRNVQYKMLPSRDVSDVFDNAIYYITRLTEKEIKEADERLWQFAKEVE